MKESAKGRFFENQGKITCFAHNLKLFQKFAALKHLRASVLLLINDLLSQDERLYSLETIVHIKKPKMSSSK